MSNQTKPYWVVTARAPSAPPLELELGVLELGRFDSLEAAAKACAAHRAERRAEGLAFRLRQHRVPLEKTALNA